MCIDIMRDIRNISIADNQLGLYPLTIGCERIPSGVHIDIDNYHIRWLCMYLNNINLYTSESYNTLNGSLLLRFCCLPDI